MKKIFTLLVLVTSFQVSFAQQDVFKIDYTVSIDESLKAEIAGSDSIENSMDGLFFDIMEELKNQAVMQAWVGKDQYKIQSNFLDTWVQITDNNTHTVVRLDSANSRFTKLDFESTNMLAGPINLENKETAIIAGFPCKLAIMEIESEEEGTEPAIVEIWYTEKIPQIVWGEYQYLRDVPGAVLKISTAGASFFAIDIKKIKTPNNFFQIPDNFTEVDDLENLESETFEDVDLGEDLVAYFDSTSYQYGLSTTEGTVLTEPKFSSIGPFNNGYAIASNEASLSAIIDNKGNNKTDFIYEYIYFDPELNAYQYSIDGRMSMMDVNGTAIWKNHYDYFSPFTQSFSVANLDSKSGIIDRKGDIIVPFSDRSILVNDNYYYITDEEGTYKAYDIKNNKLILSGYAYLFVTNVENLLKVSEDGENFGLVNSKGEVILPMEYGYITDFQNGTASAMKNNSDEEIIINSKGEKITN